MSFNNLSFGQQVALTVAPAISGTLSIIGSAAIVWMIADDWSKKIKNVKYRFLLCLCLADIVNSVVFVVWSLPLPKDTPGVWGAKGNLTTCQIQRLFLQFGCIGSFYNAALSMYFKATLCDGLSEKEIAKKYEFAWHFMAIAWPLITGFIALYKQLFSVTGVGCFIAPDPLGCNVDKLNIDCERNPRAPIYSWLFTGVPLLLLVGYISYCMGKIYTKVRDISQRSQAYNFRPGNSNQGTTDGASRASSTGSSIWSSLFFFPRMRRESSNEGLPASNIEVRIRETAIQAFLYVSAYMFTHIWAFGKTIATKSQTELGKSNIFSVPQIDVHFVLNTNIVVLSALFPPIWFTVKQLLIP